MTAVLRLDQSKVGRLTVRDDMPTSALTGRSVLEQSIVELQLKSVVAELNQLDELYREALASTANLERAAGRQHRKIMRLERHSERLKRQAEEKQKRQAEEKQKLQAKKKQKHQAEKKQKARPNSVSIFVRRLKVVLAQAARGLRRPWQGGYQALTGTSAHGDSGGHLIHEAS